MSAIAALGATALPSMLASSHQATVIHSQEYRTLVFDLLKDWLDGLIRHQVINPSDLKVHGMLNCPSCDKVHTRSMDAVYPFLYMAKATGDDKYLSAGIAAMEWGDNVTCPDGSWTNELKPNSWNGITVFGAISLAEALHYHGDLLDQDRRARWIDRLSRAAEFCYKKFNKIDATNVNYGATNIYAMSLLGRVLKEPRYTVLSKKLAEEVKSYFTEDNTFLYGEIKPTAHKLSAKGLHGIDLGYNLEESLNSIVMYALNENDEALLELATKSLNTHLEFVLPDGGFDNSWGTRMYKWSYWGSRTCDGCQPAFGMMAAYNPAFGTAAFKNTELLSRCTTDGLLYGGPHFVSHGIKPCIHHTFSHVKPLAAMLDHWDHLPKINKDTPLPREVADGLQYYKELDVSLFARGDWRGTVSAYDAEYDTKGDYRQATGGSLSLLFHNKVGLLCAASMAVYKLKEVYNQQLQPGKDIALTPRVETYKGNDWYTNLFDLTATFDSMDQKGKLSIDAKAQLKNEARNLVSGTASDFDISYECTKKALKITASTAQEINEQTAFVLPIVSKSTENCYQKKDNTIVIEKPEGLVIITSNVPIKVMDMPRDRTFNQVPGVEALPILAYFLEDQKSVEISIEVKV